MIWHLYRDGLAVMTLGAILFLWCARTAPPRILGLFAGICVLAVLAWPAVTLGLVGELAHEACHRRCGAGTV